MPVTLITGVNGFTGHYLATELARRGHRVVGVVREPVNGTVPGVDQVYVGDIAEPDTIGGIVAEVAPDYVIHLAAIAFVAHGDIFEMYRTNMFGTRCLLESCKALPRPVRSILIPSSANVYGNRVEGSLSESAAMDPANDYGVTKVAVEHIARLYSQDLPIIITRPFNYTGVGQSDSFLVPKIVNALKRKDAVIELGNLDVERDFSDVRTLVEAYIRLLNSPDAAGQTFNVSSGKTVALRNIIEDAMRLADHRIEVRVNPAFVRANEIRTLCGDCSKLTSVVGPLPPIDFADTLKWMLEN